MQVAGSGEGGEFGQRREAAGIGGSEGFDEMASKKRRMVAVLGLTGAVMVGTMTAAMARNGNGPEDIQNSYVHFSGNIYWYANGQGPANAGGMDVYGNLYNSAGGNHAKIQGKVEGYSYTTLWNTDGSKNGFYGDYTVYDPQATESDYGWVNACHVNNWSPDNCSAEYNHR